MANTTNKKFYNVTLTFSIPVIVNDTEESKIDAYYEAVDLFPDFSVNEAEIKFEVISENEFIEQQKIIDKLHQAQYKASKK